MGTVVPVCTSTSLLSTSICHMVTGSYSHIMVMQLEDIADYNSYLRERLSKLPGVASIQTQVLAAIEALIEEDVFA